MTGARLFIDLARIEHNARTVTRLCAEHGIRVTGVTKGCCGHPGVARAMLSGGVDGIGDSRLENIRRMREAGIDTNFTLLRLPALSEVDAVMETAGMSLNSEINVLHELSRTARARGTVHDVIGMVDCGDLREGWWPDELLPAVRQVLELPGVRLRGLGTNLSCFAGVLPTRANMEQLVGLVAEVERTFDVSLGLVSAMNSSGLDLLAAGELPARVNHARIGEAILLGRETTRRAPWPGTHQDAFRLEGEVLELKTKPSLPNSQRGQDAFGGQPEFEDRGDILRALVGLGRADVEVAGITPLNDRIRVLGASSGYLSLDVSALGKSIRVGDRLDFSPDYSALLRAMGSAYVEKQVSDPGTD